jgi:DegV family protein with EDD domain
MNIAVVTDSNSGIYPEEAKQMGIWVVPMPVTINGREYLETIDLEQDFFFRSQEEGANITTSQPSPGALTELWDKLLETHDGVLYLPMTSGLSSSHATASALAEDYDGRVAVPDIKRISVPLWQAVQDALLLVKKGLTLAEISQRLEEKALCSSIYITPTTLEYLKKGGRITPAAAAIGTVLNLKPVLQIQGGQVDAYTKARGIRQAVDKMFAALDRDLETRFAGKPVHIFAAYSGERSFGKTWQAQVQSHYPDQPVRCDPLALSICCHTGSGAMGVGCAEYEVA